MVKSYKVNLNKRYLVNFIRLCHRVVKPSSFQFSTFLINHQLHKGQRSNVTDGCDAHLIMMAPGMVILLNKKMVTWFNKNIGKITQVLKLLKK